jgi:hypothetical protein
VQKVFVSYRLRPGVSVEQYKAWSGEIDQRITPGQKGVIRFEVYSIEGADKGEPFCQIVEDIEVESFEAFTETVKGSGMAYVWRPSASLSTSRPCRRCTAPRLFPPCCLRAPGRPCRSKDRCRRQPHLQLPVSPLSSTSPVGIR